MVLARSIIHAFTVKRTWLFTYQGHHIPSLSWLTSSRCTLIIQVLFWLVYLGRNRKQTGNVREGALPISKGEEVWEAGSTSTREQIVQIKTFLDQRFQLCWLFFSFKGSGLSFLSSSPMQVERGQEKDNTENDTGATRLPHGEMLFIVMWL